MKPLALLLALTLPASAVNVVFILADDFGFMAIGKVLKDTDALFPFENPKPRQRPLLKW